MDPLRRAVQQLGRLPGVGDKTATRFAYWLLRQPPDVAQELADALVTLREGIFECTVCCDLSHSAICRRCCDPERLASKVCVVERPQDVTALDGAAEWRGRYHVLHGAISPLEGVGPNDLRIRALLARLTVDAVEEVVIATDPDVEGDTTALYLAKVLKPLGVRVTRLAHGIGVGTEIEYADRGSIARAIEARREV